MLGGSSHLVNGFITPIISGLTLLIPLITGVISGMSHQVGPFHLCVFSPQKKGLLLEQHSNSATKTVCYYNDFLRTGYLQEKIGASRQPT